MEIKYIKEEYIFGLLLPPLIGKILNIASIVGFEEWAKQTLTDINIYKIIGFTINISIIYTIAYLLNFKYKYTMNIHKGNLAIMFIIAMSSSFSLGLLTKIAKSLPEKLVPIEIKDKHAGIIPNTAIRNVKFKLECNPQYINYETLTGNTPTIQFLNALTDNINNRLSLWAAISTCYTDTYIARQDYCKIIANNKNLNSKSYLFYDNDIRLLFVQGSKAEAEAIALKLSNMGYCFSVGQLSTLKNGNINALK